MSNDTLEYIKVESEDETTNVRFSWNSAATTKLIKEFKECKELWDPKNTYYKDKDARAVKLEYLAEVFGTTTEEISRKVHNLRSQFNTELRKIRKRQNGYCPNYQGLSGWEYFDSLLFLLREPSLDTSLTMENVNIELAEFQAEEELEFGSARAQAQPPKVYAPQRVAASAPPPLPQSANPMFWPEEPQPKIRPGPGADECQIFGDFVASELRTLRSDESRKRLKRIIQKAILNIGEEEDVNIING